jgi:hypothetical protein
MALLQQNGSLHLFCGFAVKKVTITMSSPSFMVVVLWKRRFFSCDFFLFFFVFCGAFGLVH